jgi:hypothetical protein
MASTPSPPLPAAPPPRPSVVDRVRLGLPRGPGETFTFVIRWVIPGIAVVAGAVAMTFGTDTALEGGAGLMGAGLAIVLFDRMFRLGAESDVDRVREALARDYYTREGRWPSRRELDAELRAGMDPTNATDG